MSKYTKDALLLEARARIARLEAKVAGSVQSASAKLLEQFKATGERDRAGERGRTVDARMAQALEMSGGAVPASIKSHHREPPSIARGFSAGCTKEEAERILARRGR